MFSEKIKIRLILTLALSALVIDMLVLLDMLSASCKVLRPFTQVLFAISLFDWGWAPAFGLAIAAIVATIYWRPGSQVLRALVILLSVVALILTSLWLFGLYFITHLNP